MNKVIINIGLLIFFISIIIFSKMKLPVEDVLIRSFAVSIVLTIMVSVIIILFIRAMNRISVSKKNENQKI
jgi:membrane protein implicated in regulation of membrane protease activity